MLNANGWAGVPDRRIPLELDAVARYVRHELGPGTQVDYLLAEIAAPLPRPNGRGRRLRALARGLRTTVRGVAAAMVRGGRKVPDASEQDG